MLKALYIVLCPSIIYGIAKLFIEYMVWLQIHNHMNTRLLIQALLKDNKADVNTHYFLIFLYMITKPYPAHSDTIQ
jgi:hypothetical protein